MLLLRWVSLLIPLVLWMGGIVCAPPSARTLGCVDFVSSTQEWYVLYQFDLGSSFCVVLSEDADAGRAPLCIANTTMSAWTALASKRSPLAQTVAQLFVRDSTGKLTDTPSPNVEHIVFDSDFSQLVGDLPDGVDRLAKDFESLHDVKRMHGIAAYSIVAQEGFVIFHSNPYFPMLAPGPNGPRVVPPTDSTGAHTWDTGLSVIEQYYICVSITKESSSSIFEALAAMNPFVTAHRVSSSIVSELGRFATPSQPFSGSVFAAVAWPSFLECFSMAGVDPKRQCLRHYQLDMQAHSQKYPAKTNVTILVKMRAAEPSVCVSSNADGTSLTLDYSWGLRPWSSPGFMTALVGPHVARGFVCFGTLFTERYVQTAAAVCIRNEHLWNVTLDAFNFVEAVCQAAPNRRIVRTIRPLGTHRTCGNPSS
eukprot:Opistho-2@30868